MMGGRSRGEMDITSVFGTDVLGSSPGGSTKTKNPAGGRIFRVVLAGAGPASAGAGARRGRGILLVSTSKISVTMNSRVYLLTNCLAPKLLYNQRVLGITRI